MREFRSTLQMRMILVLVLVSAAMTALVTGLEMAQKLQEGMANLRQTFAQIRDSQLSTLYQNLWVFDERSIRLQMQNMKAGTSVVRVEVADDLGGVRTEGEGTVDGEPITVTYPIVQPGNPKALGTLTLVGTDAPLRRAIAAQLPVILLTELAKAITAAIVLFFVFQRLFGRHLTRIAGFTDSLSIENLSQRLVLDRPHRPGNRDELDRLADALNRMAIRLRNEVEDRHQAERQVAAKNKELEQIVYVASHDLRSPLVNVDGYSREVEALVKEALGLLASEADPGPGLTKLFQREGADLKAALGYIRRSARQMDKLLKGLLELSRSGRAALRIVALNMDEVVRRVAETFEFQAGELGAQITVEPLPPCRADEVQVGQVFSNLLSNALRYREPSRPLRVRIGGVAEGTNAVYFVEDNGIGIAPEHREKVFELFHRLNPAATEGDGLGLTLVRQIVNRLDGSVRVESAADQGCRFLVTLPAEVPAPAGGEL